MCVCVRLFVCLFVCFLFVCLGVCACHLFFPYPSPPLPLSFFPSFSSVVSSVLSIYLHFIFPSFIHHPWFFFPFSHAVLFLLFPHYPFAPFPFLVTFILSACPLHLRCFLFSPQFLPFPLISFSAPFLSVPVVFYLPLNFSRSP